MTMTAEAPPIDEAVEPAFESAPLLERYSYLLGEVLLYAPDAPTAQWMQLPWRIVTRNGWEGRESAPLVYVVKPETAVEAVNHLGAIQHSKSWARHYLWDS